MDDVSEYQVTSETKVCDCDSSL